MLAGGAPIEASGTAQAIDHGTSAATTTAVSSKLSAILLLSATS